MWGAGGGGSYCQSSVWLLLSEFSVAWGKRGEGARMGGSSAS